MVTYLFSRANINQAQFLKMQWSAKTVTIQLPVWLQIMPQLLRQNVMWQ